MGTKPLRRLLILGFAGLLALGLMVPSASAQAPPRDEAGSDPAVGAINPSYRASDSPWLQLPEEMLSWPQMLPPEPGEVEAVAVEDPTAVVIYNIATGETVQIPSSEEEQQPGDPGLRSTPAYSGLLPPGMVPESVFLPDDRVRISPTTSFPWLTVTKLFMTFPNGASGGCSGAIIGCPDGHGYHILTAGHCVYSHGNGGWATSVKVYPGLDASYAPYNYAWATNLRSYTGWTSSAMTEHDWAMVTLDRNVGDFTGWMGRMTASSSNSIYTGGANTAGYPCNVYGGTCFYPVTPSNSMWYDYDYGRTANEYNHWYWMDTQPGQSGSPVWRYVDPDRWIITIHTTGDDGSGSNHGTRLNQDKFDRIFTWCNDDTPPIDRADLIDDGQSWSGFSPTTVSPGDTSFHAWSDVRNVGTASSGGFYVQYRASTNTVCTTSDFLIGTDYVPSISPFAWADSDWTGTFPSGLANGTYYVCWIIDSGGSVTEFDESNNTAYKSSYQLVVCNLPSTPSLVSPANGSSTCDTTPLLDWSAVSGADYYHIQVDDSSGFGSPVINTTTSGSSYTPSSSLAAGTYYWRVRAHNSCGYGSWSTIRNFTVIVPPTVAPSLSVPANGSSTCDTTPTFDWSTVSGATSYRIQVDDDARFGSPEIDTTTASSSYTPGSPLPPGTYYWRVRGSNTCGEGPWSAAWSVTVVVPPTAAPGLSAPANGSSTCDTTPTFDWSAVSGATSYRIQVDDDPGFGSPYIDTTSASSSYTPGSALPPGTYYWRVRGSNTCGDGPWSAAWSVTVVVPPTAAPGLSAPANGSSTCDTTPTFEWSTVGGATSYRIQVDDDPGFGSPEIDTSSGSPNYTPGSALPPGIYYWRVRGSNTCGEGPWSTTWSLTVMSPPLAPGLSAPANGSSTCDTTPTFDWSSVTGAIAYQIQVDDDPGFGSPYIDTTTATSEFTPGAALPGGTYHWRVRGSNACGYGSWSADWSIAVVLPPLAPNPILPANGASTTDTTPDLDWSSPTGATSYRLQVAGSPSFTPTEIDATTTDSNYTPASPLSLGWHYWRVRGSNSCGDSPWSTVYEYWIVTRLYLPVIMRSYP